MLTDWACNIEVWLDSDNTKEKAIKEQYDSLIEKTTTKYTPKKGFETDIQLPKNHNIRIGQMLRVKGKAPADFIDYTFHKGFNHPILILDFVDERNDVVARKSLGREVYNIIKGHLNGHDPRLTILRIDTPDKYTLEYLEHIKAIVKVDFQQQSL